MSTVRYIVTLVHGTFAPQAAWTQHDSNTCRYLQESVPGEIFFHPFRWTGGNRISARSGAALQLQHHLRTLLDEQRDAVHVVIAHSHGGNVVLRAMKAPDLRERLDGIACLSTPFLSVAWKSFGDALLVNLAVVLGLAALKIGAWLFERYGWTDNRFLIPAVIFIWLVLVVAAAEIHDRLKKSSERVRDDLEIATERLPPVLLIRSPADEATASLATVQFVTWATSVFGRFASTMAAYPLKGLSKVIEKVTDDATALPMILILWPVIVLIVTPLLPNWVVRAVFAARFMDVVWLAMPSLIVCGGILALTIVQAVFSLGFGPDVAVRGTLLELSPEPVPPGKWTIHQLLPSDDPELRHARSYRDPRALEILASWMKRLGKKSRDG